MKVTDLISLSTRMFTTRPMRTLLTILGVGIGIGAVLFLVSLGYGLQNAIIGQITTADALLSLDVSPGTSGLIVLNQENADSIRGMDNVETIARRKNISAQLATGEFTSDSMLYAVDSEYFRLGGVSADSGIVFENSNNRYIVISSATAKLLNLEEEKILGKQIAITLFISNQTEEEVENIDIIEVPELYTISGIIKDDTISFAYAPLDTLSIADINSFDLLKVKVANKDVSESIRDQIINGGFIVSSLSDIINQANRIFRIIQIVLGIFGLIALIVSAIGMFNTMTIALLERINEIGIMRSVGVTKNDIRKLFLIESMIMGFLGGIGGVILGFLAGEIANAGVNILAQRFGGIALDLFYQPPWFVLVIIVFSTFIGFLTGIFPSRRAANMDPLEALRYK